MRECPHCGRRASALDRHCSICSAPLDEQRPDRIRLDEPDFPDPLDLEDADLAPIARFLNAAEAGYFAHELRLAERMAVVITAEEDFDVVAGHWATRFLLCVREANAVAAAETLARLVEDSESEDLVPRHQPPADDPEPAGQQATDVFDPFWRVRAEITEPAGVGWVPLVLTLAAGSAAIWGVRRIDEPPRPPAAPIKRQDAEQPGPSRPGTFPHENGHGQRQFWLDGDRDRAARREDARGSGVLSVEQRSELPVP